MHLLDTDTLTHLHAGHPQVIAHLRAVDDPVVGTTIITKSELLRGRIDFLLKAVTTQATTSWVVSSTPMWILRQVRRLLQPCLRTFHSPSPYTFSPLESTTTCRTSRRSTASAVKLRP